MGDAVGFEGVNKVFRAPAGMKNCHDLEVFEHGGQIISCWRMTEEELKQINETGVVWLSVHGTGTPPVYGSGTALVTTGGRPSRAEPVIPRKLNGGEL